MPDRQRIVIKYPPDFDGELHIEAERAGTSSPLMAEPTRFTFTHVSCGSTWETLVAAAKAIVAQDNRARRS